MYPYLSVGYFVRGDRDRDRDGVLILYQNSSFLWYTCSLFLLYFHSLCFRSTFSLDALKLGLFFLPWHPSPFCGVLPFNDLSFVLVFLSFRKAYIHFVIRKWHKMQLSFSNQLLVVILIAAILLWHIHIYIHYYWCFYNPSFFIFVIKSGSL